ncbi:RNA polymerase sigma factor [Sphingobacterium siyangense]|nr:RNA polymerase sigma-70 factor [Sphingobacterium siyangense]
MKDNIAILHKLSRGNQIALRVLYDKYAQMVYQFALHILKDEHIAEEIVQDTFLQLWDSREKIDIDSNIRTFIYVISRNKCFNRLKQLKRYHSLFEPLCSEGSHDCISEQDPLAEKEVNEALEQLVQKLPKKQQLVFRMSRFEGLSHQEIAQQLSISTNTVKNHLVSSLKFIKEELKGTPGDSSIIYPLLFFTFFFID